MPEPKDLHMGGVTMTRRYHTLVSRPRDKSAPWVPQFGDYDREGVVDEMADMSDNAAYDDDVFRIVASGDTQAEIDAAVRAINAR